MADLFIRGLPHSITARYFSSNPSDSGSLRTPCPPASKPAGRRGITPAFGYGAPHSSAGGTLTLLNNVLLSTHYEPSRSPLAFGRFPGVSGYTASLLRRFRAGTRRVSPVALHHLVTVLSLPTPPQCFGASVLATLHAPFARKVLAQPSGIVLSRPYGFACVKARWLADHS